MRKSDKFRKLIAPLSGVILPLLFGVLFVIPGSYNEAQAQSCWYMDEGCDNNIICEEEVHSQCNRCKCGYEFE